MLAHAPARRLGAVIVGGGTMGLGVAACFISQGWTVCVVEPNAAIRAAVSSLLASLLPELPLDDLDERLSCVDSLTGVSWDGVQIVSENAPEEMSVKRALFAVLETCAPPGVLLSSNSSTLSMHDICAGLADGARMFGMHFLMPAHIVPLVELLDTGLADSAVIDRAEQILLSLGKKPVRLKKEMPGFLVNRIQAALMREALALINDGVASAKDVDDAVRFGFGFRYAACGPILQKEHSGWSVSHTVYQAVFPTLCNDTHAPDVLQQLIDRDQTGMRKGKGFVEWTDSRANQERQRFNAAMRLAAQALQQGDDAAPVPWRDLPARD